VVDKGEGSEVMLSTSDDTTAVGLMLQRRSDLDDPFKRLDRMLEIRAVEDKLQKLFNEGLIRGSTHLSNGQEAIAVGIAAAIRPSDWVTCTYRGHGTALALGLSPVSVIGEIVGLTSGCVGGLGGSMHLSGPEVGLLPTFAIVGAGYPVAAGAALTAQYTGTDGIAVGICGDGATNIGAFHETLNLASIWSLPVIFVIENNLYGEYTRINLSTPVEHLADRGSSYDMPSEIVDGQSIDAVMSAMARATDRARSGQGPTLLEMKTYRYSGHSRADQAAYRPAGELDEWLARDPIMLYATQLGLSEAEVNERRIYIQNLIDSATDEALKSPEPTVHDLFAHVIAQ
jgi:TPP-dependent pyruvate/acetoin dehydrogenase alpha subunit